MADVAMKRITPGIVLVALFGSHLSILLGRKTHTQEAHGVSRTMVCRMVHAHPCFPVTCCSPL